MKLNKVLHPEVIQGRRGDPFVKAMYEYILPKIEFRENLNDYKAHGYAVPIFQGIGQDELFYNHCCLCWKFLKEKGQVYYCGKEFTQALAKVDRELPIDKLPDRFIANFSFPDGAVFDESGEVWSAYVCIGPAYEMPLQLGKIPPHDKSIWISYIDKQLNCGVTMLPVIKESVGSIMDKYKCVDMVLTEDKDLVRHQLDATPAKRVDLYRLIINLTLYVNSLDPDLSEERPVKELRPAEKRRKALSGELLNQCTVPVTLVSWNYKQERHYNVDSTWIDTFMRWQRCGKDFSQVKLVWVRPHERHYKKEGEAR